MIGKLSKKVILITLTLLLIASGSFAAGMANPNHYSIPIHVVDAGGGTTETTSNYSLLDAFGQYGPIGTSEGGTYTLNTGFIYTRLAPHFGFIPPPVPINLWVNDRRFLSGDILQPGKPDNTVKVEAILSRWTNITIESIAMYVDTAGIPLTPVDPSNASWEGIFATPSESGTHRLTFFISDEAANKDTVTIEAKVMGGAAQVVGTPLNYPNPFKPLSGDPNLNTTRIQYTLSSDSNITLVIYDITGREIKRVVSGSGQQGGKAGVNNVTWNGKTIFGDVSGNGMYVYKIISGGKVIGTGKLVVLD
jgi:hypothetical protein